MDEFTVAEKDRINLLYGTDFKDITPDDAMLIGRWEAHKALRDEEFKAKVKALETEAAARIENNNAITEQAFANLQELQQAALERLERIEDGI